MDLTLPERLEQNARTEVKVAGTSKGIRRAINFAAGSSKVTVAGTDSATGELVTVTIDVSLSDLATALAGNGLDPSAGTLVVDPEEFAADMAGAGLTSSGDALAVGEGHGIDVAADAIAVDETELVNLLPANLTSGYRLPFAGTSAPGSPTEGDEWYDTTNDRLNKYDGTQWVQVNPKAAVVATSQTTTSTTYADLSTTGPAVTILTGTSALVTVGGNLVPSGAGTFAIMSFAVSGASTVAAADATAAATETDNLNISKQSLITGLTAGANTFTAKYRVVSGTGTFQRRTISAVGLL